MRVLIAKTPERYREMAVQVAMTIYAYKSERRYMLVAYVSKAGVSWSDNQGTVPYRQVFTQRSDGDRFAVLRDQRTQYLCVDMDETEMDTETFEFYMPEPMVFPTVEAAVMAARLKL